MYTRDGKRIPMEDINFGRRNHPIGKLEFEQLQIKVEDLEARIVALESVKPAKAAKKESNE
jgi:hypothetical protein